MVDAAIQSTKYQGHQGSVLCLDLTDDDNLLLSGSEDQTARLWDVRDSNKRRACLCIRTHGEVLSASFAPFGRKESPTEVSQSMFAQDHTIYLSVENSVYEYDLRQAKTAILQQPSRDLSPILQNQDEVNQITLSYFRKQAKGRRKGKSNVKSTLQPTLYLAAADDAGTVRFMETQSNNQSEILHHDCNGVAVVPTCVFRPRSKCLELASGGTDCKIHLWDLLRPKRPVSSYTIRSTENVETSKPQVCNPPMVHSLSWTSSGRLLAAGLGDGNIPIFSIANRNLVQTGFLSEGHDSSVASIVFPTFLDNNNNSNQERILLSGGSDGAILCWDIGADVLGVEDDDNFSPANIFPASLLQSEETSFSLLSSPAEELSERIQPWTLDCSQPKILFGIPHGTKVNWMATTSSRPLKLFVADTSNDITTYSIPLLP